MSAWWSRLLNGQAILPLIRSQGNSTIERRFRPVLECLEDRNLPSTVALIAPLWPVTATAPTASIASVLSPVTVDAVFANAAPAPASSAGAASAASDTVNASPGGSSNPLSAPAADAPLTAAGDTVQATERMRFTAVVATFTDADPNARTGDFQATISWTAPLFKMGKQI